MDKKINVALFVDNFAIIDGVVMVVNQYAKRLRDKANVYVVCPNNKNNVSAEDYSVITWPSVRIPIFNYSLAAPFGKKRLINRLRNLKIDLVHVHSPFIIGGLGVKIAEALGVPCVGTLHSQYKQDFETYLKSESVTNSMLNSIMKVYNQCDEVWTVNEKVQQLLYTYGYQGKSFIIPNATDDAPISDVDAAVAEINKTYGIGNDEKVMMYLGRVVAQKNVFFIEKVLARLKEKGFANKFIFVGDGHAFTNLKEAIDVDGIAENVILTGSISDREHIKKLYARADLFVFPSFYDTDGIVKYEAAAQCTPTIFAEGTLALAGIEDGVNGYVGPNDVDGFADKIIQVFADVDRHAEVCKNVREMLYRTWDKTVADVYQRYNYLIDKYKGKKQQNT